MCACECVCVSHLKELYLHTKHDIEGEQVIASFGTASCARNRSGGSWAPGGGRGCSRRRDALRCCIQCRAQSQRDKPAEIPAWRGASLRKAVCLPASFVLNSCRNKPHQRCHSLSSAFRFKAKFQAATSLSSSRNPNCPLGSHRVTTFLYQVF